MNILKTLILTLTLSLLALPSWGADLTMDDLVKRNDLYYKKFSNEPFTGKVSGQENGKFKSGKRVGEWEFYYDSGQLEYIGKYKDGKEDGEWEGYWDNGQLSSVRNYKDGEKDGVWEFYYDFGALQYKGKYEDGILDGLEELYSEDGYLMRKGNYSDGKKEGYWEYFNEDGTVEAEKTGTYKNGVKQD